MITSPLTRRIRLAKRRIRRLVLDNPLLGVWELTAMIAAEFRALAPDLRRILTPALLRAWVGAARRFTLQVQALAPPPLPPPAIATAAGSADRWPAIEAAVANLAARRVMTWDDYQRLAAEAKNTAYSVVGAMTEQGVLKVRDTVQQAINEGMRLDEFADEVVRVGVPAHQVETVFRTQIGQAQSAGKRAVLALPAVAAEFPYVAYFAIHDSRTGDRVPGLIHPTHLMMETSGIQGTNIYRVDDPVILKFWPPWRWNCRCEVVPISIEDAADRGIREAATWLRDGFPPPTPAWVPHPPFDLPPGWPRSGGSIRPLIVP